ncbi:MAG: hypothetical protein H0V01_10645 [Bacteroidetes bacterium]|nr:hypothetical protein [Bacteroidota bacterium]HET6244810.1 hypothetical protein [Bacteroidia bacterium]
MKNNYLFTCILAIFCVSCQSQNITSYNSKLWKQDTLGLNKNRTIINEKVFYEDFLNQKDSKVIKKLGKPDYLITSGNKTYYNYCRASYKYGSSIEDFKNDKDCRGSYVSLIIEKNKVTDIVFVNSGG